MHEIKFIDGERWKDKYGRIWQVSQKKLIRKYIDTTENICDGRYALGNLVHFDFEKVD